MLFDKYFAELGAVKCMVREKFSFRNSNFTRKLTTSENDENGNKSIRKNGADKNDEGCKYKVIN